MTHRTPVARDLAGDAALRAAARSPPARRRLALVVGWADISPDWLYPVADMTRRYHLTTFGCQMNEHDSERMKGMLESLGYREAPERAQADLILFNTCSIREAADSRFLAHLGEAKALKRARPGDGRSASAAAGRSRSRTRCSSASRSSTWRSGPGRSTGSPSS